MKKMYKNKSQGFTLIELLVAVGIFTTVIAITSSLFGQYVTTQRRNIAEQRLLEDVRFSMEVIEREIRTGYGDTYTVSSNGRQVMFRNQNGLCVQYEWVKENTEGFIRRAERETGGNCIDAAYGNHERLTTSDVDIEAMRFDVVGLGEVWMEGEERLRRQGFVTTMIEARSAKNDTVPPFITQSTVTSRQSILFSSDI